MVAGVTRSLVSILAATALLGSAPAPAPRAAHPLHTSLTEITHGSPSGTITVRVRMFAQDVDSALSVGRQRTIAPDGHVLGYVNRHVALSDARGNAVALVSCGITREGEALFTCLRGAPGSLPSTLTLRNDLLFDLFDDQINIVQVVSAGSKRSLLFTRHSPRKRLG